MCWNSLFSNSFFYQYPLMNYHAKKGHNSHNNTKTYCREGNENWVVTSKQFQISYFEYWHLCYYNPFLNIISSLSSYLSALDFCNYSVWNIQFDELDFFPIWAGFFLPAVACKIQFWNRIKIKFFKPDILNWKVAKIEFR